jgi:tight adherence protein B
MIHARLAVLALGLLFVAMLVVAAQEERRRHRDVGRRLAKHVAVFRAASQDNADAAALPDNWLAIKLFRANLPYRAVIVAVPLGLLGFVAAATLLFSPFLAMAGGVAVCAILLLALLWMVERRQSLLQAAMPVFLDRLRQNMLVGASVSQALQRTIAVSPDIVRWVFEPVERRLSAGGELAETLEWAAERHGGAELAALVAAVTASLRFGGRLSEALASLSLTERRRLQVQQEMRSATAEVRAGSAILALLPLCVGGWLLYVTPSFLAYFVDPDRGRPVFYAVGGLYLTGLFLLRQISRPRY